ncbi:FHA domain-containing protein [Acaryochloris thomasi]|nr:FHA domain-containing protein [Acaryochloris thomasi]
MPTSRPEPTEHHMLIIQDGNGRRVVQLEDVAYSVGRDTSNAIVLDGESISRQHALLVRLPVPQKGYRYRILDGNSEGKPSANGVYINGDRRSMHELSKSDIIRFGNEIKATYMTVAMEQVEFLHYLESLSYQSLKSDVVDSKATMVSPEFMGGSPPVTTLEAQPRSAYPSQNPQEPKFTKATVRMPRPKSLQPRVFSLRLWMVGIGAIATLSAGSIWFFTQGRTGTPTPAGAVTAPSSPEL